MTCTKAIVFTLGFDVTSIVARLSETGLEGSEQLIFIIPTTSSPRAISSQKAIENHISVLNARGFKLTYRFLAVEDQDSSKAIASIYSALVPYEEIFMDLSGGLRFLIVATFLAAMALRHRIKEVVMRLESDGRRVTIPLFEPGKLTRAEANILLELKSLGFRNQRELAASVSRRVSSISRTLARLQKMGFVISTGSHPTIFQITPLGEIFLHDYEASNGI
jgi:CRISPR locus-related DNA-binding protein